MRRGLESSPSSCDDVATELTAVLAIGWMAVPRLRLVAVLDIATDGGRFGGMMQKSGDKLCRG